MHRQAGAADGDVGAGSLDLSGADRDGVLLVGHLGPLAARRQLAQEDDRVVVADGRLQQPLGVVGVARRDHLDQGHVHEQRVHGLAVVGAGGEAAAVLGHEDDRDLRLAAEHVAHAAGLVGDLVHGQIEERPEHEVDHRPQPGHRRAHAHAGHRQLRDRRVHHPPGPELAVQAPRAGEHPQPDVLADEQDALIGPHLLSERLSDRGYVGLLRHGNCLIPTPTGPP